MYHNNPSIVDTKDPLMLQALKSIGSSVIRTHASEETGALNQRLRPLGHATLVICQSFPTILTCCCFHVQYSFWKIYCPRWGSNSRPSDYETDALPTALWRLYSYFNIAISTLKMGKKTKKGKKFALAGNRTRVNCLEGSYAHHYTTNT